MRDEKKRRVVFALVVLSVLALAIGLLSRSARQDRPLSPAEVKRSALAAKRTRAPSAWRSLPAATAFAAPVSEGEAAPEPVAADRPAATEDQGGTATLHEICASDWTAVANDSVDVLTHRIARGQFALSVGCRDAMKKASETQSVLDFVSRCTEPAVTDANLTAFCVSQAEPFRLLVLERLATDAGQAGNVDFSGVEMTSLLRRIGSNLRSPARLSESDLDATIAMADEVTARDPDVYEAYKAKLASYLMKEVRFGASVGSDAYAEVIDELNAFRLVETPPAVPPAVDDRLDDLVAELDALALQREELRSELEVQSSVQAEALKVAQDQARIRTENGEDLFLEGQGGVDPVVAAATQKLAELSAEDRLLAADESDLRREQEGLQREQQVRTLTENDGVDSEVVRIPFVRLLAAGDWEALSDESTAYIEESPGSPLGYYFKAQAEWRSGDRAAAHATLSAAIARGAASEGLRYVFEREATRDSRFFADELARSIGQAIQPSPGPGGEGES